MVKKMTKKEMASLLNMYRGEPTIGSTILTYLFLATASIWVLYFFLMGFTRVVTLLS
jgi:hypothetical protein